MWRNYFLVILIPSFYDSIAIRMKDQIAITLSNPDQYCIRLLNGTTSVGCQSDKEGNMGAVVLAQHPDDLRRKFDNLPFGISKIIAVINAADLSSNMIDTIRETGFIVGVMLIVENDVFPKKFSEDSVCPNERFYVRTKSELQECKWNEAGALHPDGFMFLSLNKPILILSNEKDIDLVVDKCYNSFNNDQSNRRCMARITQFMNAAGNAEICRRRQSLNTVSFTAQTSPMCDALYDFNLFAALPPASSQNASSLKPSTPPKVLMLASRMDISTIFSGSKGGDVSALTSIIALLAVADAIGKKLPLFQEQATKNNRQLWLSFFHGEAMEYIGSSRAVWEMEKGIFPAHPNQFQQPTANVQQIGLDDIFAFVEVQQLRASDQFNLHSSFDVYSRHPKLLDEVVKSISEPVQRQGFGVNFHKERSVPFPPSSFHSILRKSLKVPGLLLTGFGNTYESGQINSLADLEISQNIKTRSDQVRYISAAANALLNMVVDQILLSNSSKFVIDQKYVDEIVGCFFFSNNWDCKLFHTILDVKKMPSSARNMFIGTSGLSIIRHVVLSLLVRSLGEKSPVQNVSTKSQCDDLNKNQNVYNFLWQNDTTISTEESRCFRTSIYQTTAKSPAFTEENYDLKKGEYSTWMESIWVISPLELYLKPDFWLDAYAVFTALIVVLASVAIKVFMRESWFIDSHEPPTSPHQL